MAPQLSRLARDARTSPIRGMTVECARVGGVNLAQGVCDTPVPEPVRRAAQEAIEAGENTYSRYDGHQVLRQALAATAGGPTLLALHHPPFESGLTVMDSSRLRQGEVLMELLAGAPHVSRVVCGHLHRPAMAVMKGVAVTACLSTVAHPTLDLVPDAAFMGVCEPAGYQLHRFDGANWVSHTRYIGVEADPFPLR